MEKPQDRTIEFNAKLELEDYLKFNYSNFYSKGAAKIYSVICAFAVIFLIFNIIIPISLGKNMKDAMASIIFTSVFLLIFSLILPLSIRFQVKRYYNTNKLLHHSVEYIINDSFIKNANEKSTTTAEWKEVYKVTEGKLHYYIYIATIQAFVIPKRFFKNEAQEKLFRDILVTNVDKKKLKLRKEK